MIKKYDSIEIGEVWSDEFRFKTYLEVELAILESLEGKLIPEGIAQHFKSKVSVNISRIKELEKEFNNEISAFCHSITEQLSTDYGKYFHYGVSSNDITDTALSLQLKKCTHLIINQGLRLEEALKNKALQYKRLVCLGRTHGAHQEPMSFGQKFLVLFYEVRRRNQDLQQWYDNELTGQFSGEVGNYTVLRSDIEQQALEKLELKLEPLSTQVISRDHIAKLLGISAMYASVIEKISTQIRLLHLSDIAEVHEGVVNKTKDTKDEQHRSFPRASENLCGVARILKSHQAIALENNILWHESDMSHSSAEKVILPDNTGLLFYALKQLTSTVRDLVVDEKKIESKVEKEYAYLSGYLLHKCISETDLSKEQAEMIIQKILEQATNKLEFWTKIQEQEAFKAVNLKAIESMDIAAIKKIYLKEVDSVFKRAGF